MVFLFIFLFLFIYLFIFAYLRLRLQSNLKDLQISNNLGNIFINLIEIENSHSSFKWKILNAYNAKEKKIK